MNTSTLTPQQQFNGDKKHLIHFLVPYEQRFLKAVVPWVPPYISTVHLTMMTIGWSIGVAAAGFLAQSDMRWLWLFNACILMQYITDMLDGEVGRRRHTGLIKWGFYMDHLLDYVFLSSIMIGYSFLLPPSYFTVGLAVFAFSAGVMVHTFLDFSVTNNFKISCNFFGVSEMRWLLIMFNIVLMVAGKALLASILPWMAAASLLALIFIVFNSQRVYRHVDAIRQAQQEE